MRGSLADIEKKNIDVVIIDGLNISYKFNFAPQYRTFTGKNGQKTGMWYGVLNFCHGLKKRYGKCRIVITWDSKSEYKKSIYPGYKANRSHEGKDEFFENVEKMKEILVNYGIDQYFSDGYEADDIAYTLVRKYIRKNKSILLVSSDNDWLQLLQYPNVFIYKNGEVWNKKMAEEEYPVKLEQVTLYKSIIGEKKENVKPSAPRINKNLVQAIFKTGVETPKDLITLLKSKTNIKPKNKKWTDLIIENKDILKLNYRIKSLINVTKKMDSFCGKRDIKKLEKQLIPHEMLGILKRIKNEK